MSINKKCILTVGFICLTGCGGGGGGSTGSPSSTATSSAPAAIEAHSISAYSSVSSRAPSALETPSSLSNSNASSSDSANAPSSKRSDTFLESSSSLSISSAGSSDSSNSQSSKKSDTLAPYATIFFPPRASMTDANTILVRGGAYDDKSSIAGIRVNGVEATTADNYKNWQAVIPLQDGDNTLTVSTVDSESNRNNSAAIAHIKKSTISNNFPDEINKFNQSNFITMKDFALDKAHNRLLVSISADNGDIFLNNLIAVNLDTGERNIFKAHSSGGGVIALDEINNRLLSLEITEVVNNLGIFGVAAYELEDGSKSVLTLKERADQSLRYDPPTAISVNKQSNSFLLAYYTIITDSKVGLLTNNKNTYGDASISNIYDIAIDNLNNQAIVQSGDNLISVNLNNGTRSYLSRGSDANQGKAINLTGLTIDSGRVLMFGYTPIFNNGIYSENLEVIAVDIATGTRTEIKNTSGTKFLIHPIKIQVDNDLKIAYVLDSQLKAITIIDLVTNEGAILSK